MWLLVYFCGLIMKLEVSGKNSILTIFGAPRIHTVIGRLRVTKNTNVSYNLSKLNFFLFILPFDHHRNIHSPHHPPHRRQKIPDQLLQSG